MTLLEIIKQKINALEDSEELTSKTSPSNGVNVSIKLTNKEGKKFLFKPANGEHTSKWRHVPPHEQYQRERAAYLVSMALGWDLVPLTRIVQHKGKVGSIQNWVDGTTKSDKTLETYSNKFIWEAGLFDILIANIDRHSGNWLTKGNQAVLIDHGYSFPTLAGNGDPKSVILSRFAFKIWGRKIPDIFLQSIAQLKDKELQEHILGLVGHDAYKLFNARINEILETGVAKVTGYDVKERVKGIPSGKHN